MKESTPVSKGSISVYGTYSYWLDEFTIKMFIWVSEEATGFGPIFEEEPLDTVYAEDSPEPKISMNCRVRANPPAIVK